jgi:hypothetical protein
VLADFYTYFPDVHLLRINANGQNVRRFTIETDPGRYTLSSSLDNNDNLLIYGSKSAGDTLQAMYLYKFSKNLEHTFYRKTLFSAAGFQLNDFKIDNDGNIFSLIAQFQASGELFYKISRINSNSGNISWNYSIPFSRDSCDLQKLVISANERFYAIGHQLSNNYYCKGFALRIKKNGNPAGKIQAPDSITFQRLHWLSEGILDQNNHLIAIGGTTDLDTTTFNSSYLKAFAVCFSNNSSGEGERSGAEVLALSAKTAEPASEIIPLTNKLVLYPHPVTEQMTVAGLNKDEYDRLMIYNMQGALLLQQTITGTIARIDANALPDGVYLLVLHSSVTLKEKNVKFLVRR